jgi:hypothetical protein
VRVESEADVVDAAGDAPGRGPRAHRVSYPTQHVIDATGATVVKPPVSRLGEKRRALIIGESAVTSLEESPAGCFGQLALAGFGLASSPAMRKRRTERHGIRNQSMVTAALGKL